MDRPIYESIVRNFAFKTSNAEVQSTNCNVIYSNVKCPPRLGGYN